MADVQKVCPCPGPPAPGFAWVPLVPRKQTPGRQSPADALEQPPEDVRKGCTAALNASHAAATGEGRHGEGQGRSDRRHRARRGRQGRSRRGGRTLQPRIAFGRPGQQHAAHHGGFAGRGRWAQGRRQGRRFAASVGQTLLSTPRQAGGGGGGGRGPPPPPPPPPPPAPPPPPSPASRTHSTGRPAPGPDTRPPQHAAARLFRMRRSRRRWRLRMRLRRRSA